MHSESSFAWHDAHLWPTICNTAYASHIWACEHCPSRPSGSSVCRFYGNSAYAGGGLFETLVEGAVSQCAFEDNMAGNSGGGLSMSEGGGNIDNSIFINNQARRWLHCCCSDRARPLPPSFSASSGWLSAASL